jgi:DNA excision repair protein ERCC-4
VAVASLQLSALQVTAPKGSGTGPPELWLDVYAQNRSTRVAGGWGVAGSRSAAAGGRGTGRAVPRKLVVDVREFMSGLPSVLHQQGFYLSPVTLEVGVMGYDE